MINEQGVDLSEFDVNPRTQKKDTENTEVDLKGFERANSVKLNSNLTESYKAKPEEQAEILQLSRQSGVPVEAVRSNKDYVKSNVDLKDFDSATFNRESPATSEFISDDVNNAIISRDDLKSGKLQAIEKSYDKLSGRMKTAAANRGKAEEQIQYRKRLFSGLGRQIGIMFDKTAAGASQVFADIDKGVSDNPVFNRTIDSAMPFNLPAISTGEAVQMSRDAYAAIGINSNEELDAAIQRAPEEIQADITSLNERFEALQPKGLTVIEEGVRGAVLSTAYQIPSLLLALSGVGAPATLTAMGTQIFNLSYGEGRSGGLSPEQASGYAAAMTVIEVGTELAPTNSIVKILSGKSGGKLKKEIARFITQDLAGEQVATLGGTLVDIAYDLDQQMEQAETPEEKIDIQLRRQAVTFVSSFISSGAQSSVAAGVNRAVQGIDNRAKAKKETVETEEAAGEAQQEVDITDLDDLDETIKTSKTKELDSETFMQFISRVDAGSEKDVYIDSEKLFEYLSTKKQKDIDADPTLTDLSERLNNTEEGVDVSMPMAQFAGFVSGTEHYAELRDHVHVNEESPTLFRQDERREFNKQYIDQIVAEAEKEGSDYVATQEVVTALTDSLSDTGQYTKAESKVVMTTVSGYLSRKAKAENKSVRQVFEEIGFTIDGPQTGAAARIASEMALLQEPAYRDAPVLFENVKNEFLDVIEEDATVDDVMDVIGEFPADQQRLLRALAKAEFLGFEFPSQAISAVFSEDIANYDVSVGIKSALGRMVNQKFQQQPLPDGPTGPSADEFADAFARGTASNPNASSTAMDLDSIQDGSSRRFLLDDGNIGYVIENDGTLGSVFKNPESSVKGAVKTIVEEAVANGAYKLNAFEGKLTEMYAANGFVEVGRDTFNPDFAPANWDTETQGTPDVVFMELQGEARDKAKETNERSVQDEERVRGSAESVDVGTETLEQGPTPQRDEDGSLAGLPRNVGDYTAQHSDAIEAIAREYVESKGRVYTPPNVYAKVNPERARQIAAAYDEMPHDPANAEVKAAFEAMATETIEQYQMVIDAGLQVEFIDFDVTGDPYSKSPREATEDIVKNNHMFVFSTKDGYGSDGEFDSSESPMLAETEFTDINGTPMLVNDLFRAVHDYFGHAKEGLGFRADGEENAWRAHSAMYSDLARKAMTTETRGQNSWVNYGPNGAKNKTASANDTVFADQKTGLMPDWVSEEARGDDLSVTPRQEAADPASDPTFEQSVTLRNKKETLKKFGLDPAKRHKTRAVAAALEARQRKKWGKIDAKDNSNKARNKIARWMVEEVLFELENPENSGVGWYSEKFQAGLDAFSEVFPELKTDKAARDTFTALVAVTSDGQKVQGNFAMAEDIYRNYRETGKFTTSKGTQRQASVTGNLKVLQELVDEMGVEATHEYLMEEMLVGDLKKLARDAGKVFKSDYKVDVKMPRAALIMGPKLGAFYANLMGADGYLTMDRWWSRTFNRYRGTLLQSVKGLSDKPKSSTGKLIGLARFKDLIGQPEISDDEAISATVEYAEAFEKRNYKNGTTIEKAANTIYKAAFINVEDAPFNAGDRSFMLDAVNQAASLLEKQGKPTSVADIQAILWYYEKKLYGELGAVQTGKISYEEAANNIIADRAGRPFAQDELGGDLPVGEEVFNEEDSGKEARGYYDPKNSVIRLNESSDLTTFLHEFAHFMLETEINSDSQISKDAGAWFKRNAADVAAEANGYGEGDSITAEDVAAYVDNKTTGDETKDSHVRRATHEQFARGYEAYLMEGKAPTVGLRNAFRQIAMWMVEAYKNMSLNVTLDDEMRQVFDRLLATEDQIEEARTRARMRPLFTDATMAGMSEEAFAKYTAENEKVKGAQTETLRDKLVAELTRNTEAWWKQERDDLIDKNLASLKNERVYVTANALKNTASTATMQADVDEVTTAIKAIEKEIKTISKSNDTVGKLIAKKGGLDRNSMQAEGVDPAEFKKKGKVFGKPLFPKTGGMSVDDVTELLNQEGFELDASGTLDLIMEMLDEDTTFVDSNVGAEVGTLYDDIAMLEEQISDIEGGMATINIKLDRATVKADYGEDRVDSRGTKSRVIPNRLTGMTATGQEGAHPDEVAGLFGYDSGGEMINELINEPTITDAAATMADKQMLDKHGDILNDGTIAKQADEAVQNDLRGEIMLRELKALNKGTRRPNFEREEIKQLAKDRIGTLSYRQNNPAKYRRGEIREAQNAAKFLAAGNKEAAANAKTQQAVFHYLALEATAARNETTKTVNKMSRYSKKKVREEIQKAQNGYWEQLVKVLNRFEFKKSATLKSVDERNLDINAWAAERMEVDGDALVLSTETLSEGYIKHWKDLPFSELQGVAASVANIEHVARYSNKIRIGDEVIDYKKYVNQWTGHIGKNAAKFDTKSSRGLVQDAAKETLGDQTRRWASQLTKIPYLASWLDGGERAGMSHDALMTGFNNALDEKLKLLEKTASPIMELMNNRSKEDRARHANYIYIEEIGQSIKGHQVLAVALNVGNKGNLRKLLLGEGWAVDESEVRLDNVKLQAVLKNMTKTDWEFVQTVWDQMNTLYPQLAEVHRKTTGLVPPKIESTPVVTPFGTFNGGYYPVKYSPQRSHKADKNQDKADARGDSLFSTEGSIQNSVTTSATQERTGFYDRIRLDINIVPEHFNETIHFITHHDAVRQLNKLIRDPAVEDAITAVLGEAEFKQLAPWLNDIAKDGKEGPTKSYIDEWMGRLRFGTTLTVMGFSASTGLMQTLGLFTTAGEVGMGHTYRAITKVLGRSRVARSFRRLFGSVEDMETGWEFAVARSKVLDHRQQTMDREIRNAMNRLKDQRGILAAVQEASMKHIAVMQTYMVDLPTWHAAYDKGVQDFGDEVRAAKYADWAVENLQGSGATKDMAMLMRNQSKLQSTFTMFMTFFSAMGNYVRDTKRAMDSGLDSPTTTASKAMFLLVIPVVAEMILRDELDEPEDEDERLSNMLTKIALYPVTSVPVVRDVVSGLGTDFGYNTSPVSSMLERGIMGTKQLVSAPLTDREVTRAALKNTTKVVGAALGIPATGQVWKSADHIFEVIEEGEDFTIKELLLGPNRN
tara:strand:- start:9824 stop:19075 length:9252 start_codon:yes stop_codon:yes gene_type:complete